MGPANDLLWEAILKSKPVFGLQAQGHIPTIETMLSQGRTWEEIGKKIGWCPKTAQKHWGWYLEEQKKGGA